jgi:hypothetical protein
MDCADKTYHQNEFGFSRKCTCHGAVHVNFGNVSLLLSKPQVSDFTEYIVEALISEWGVDDPNERCIYLPTRDYALMFAMTYQELEYLYEILDQTLLMMEVDDTLTQKEL